MKEGQIDKYRNAADDGSIPDAENPLFLFQGTSVKLLVMALNKEFSLNELAKRELTERGLNIKGEWVGFDHKGVKQKPADKKRRHL